MTSPHRAPHVDLHIDRLVLDGFRWDADTHERFRAGVETELARLLTEQGLPPAALATDGPLTAPVDLRGMPLADGAARVAQQVYAQVCDRVADRTRRRVPS